MSKSDLGTQTPSVEQFKRALLASRPVSDNHMAMLKAHFKAPGHAMSATQLSEVAGYSSYGAVNMQYGMFAKILAGHIGIEPPMRSRMGDPIWTSVIASGAEGDASAPHYTWTLRVELVSALSELPWGFVQRKR